MSTTTYNEAWLDGPKSTSFYTRTYEASTSPRKAHIIFVHGFAEHVGRYEHAFPIYASRGISVFAYDQRGFGRTALDSEKKSAGSSWGATSWKDQRTDIAFWILAERKRVGAGVPIFLVGHSMGGGEVLHFATSPPTSTEALSEITGIIACSPLIRQATPAPKWQLWIGSKAASVLPGKLIPAPVIPEDLSHDAAANEAYKKDPLIKASGSLRGIGDMLGEGISLSEKNYKSWPVKLPVLIIHGDTDRVTDHKAAEKFIADIDATDKHISIYPDGYHELANEPALKDRLFDEVSSWVLARVPEAGAAGSSKL